LSPHLISLYGDFNNHRKENLSMQNHQPLIEKAWEQRSTLDVTPALSHAIQDILDSLGHGHLRIAEKIGGQWCVHQWLKKAVLLSFRTRPNQIRGADYQWYDKVPLKFDGWEQHHFEQAGARIVPGAIVRESAYIGPDVVLMPSFVNVGAHVGQGTMVDTWSTIGSCAQIGKNCHISGGVGIGGVLEPLQANPVIIEDDCFIGARSEIAEGVIVEQGAVVSMGVFIGASTKIVDRQSGEVFQGRVPAYSVVVPGTLPSSTPQGPHLACAVIVKRVDAQTRSKTSINELLRY
jgi:2,3,4,5-tetrahydropyridine-2-carboxylate N-succinyltransferase